MTMSELITHLTSEELLSGLELIRQSPKGQGTLEMIARRPEVDVREILERGELSPVDGLVGDTWKNRPSTRTLDHAAHPDMQLTLINVRAIDLIAQTKERWSLAGDQLYVDLDLSIENLPDGTRLAIGEEAVVEITTQLHTGCNKFAARFGEAAWKWVNSPVGRELRLRGVNARVVQPGKIRVGEKCMVVGRR
jgi:MOSC domain-containing protein YiiM